MAERISVLIKLEPALLARVEAFASSAGLNRMAATVRLIERGLDGDAAAVPAPPPKPALPSVGSAPKAKRAAARAQKPGLKFRGINAATGEEIWS